MKIVAVSQRVSVHPEIDERRDALDHRLIAFLSVAGLVPVPVPNVLHSPGTEDTPIINALNMWLEKIDPEAIVLSGGEDIGIFRERDFTEDWLLNYALQYRLPVLGICRGAQIMGLRAGTGLKTVVGHVGTHHQLTGEISGLVNSYHNNALADCPPMFTVLARSDDGQIEAIRHNALPWEGWMWHPEREEIFHARDIQRLQTLFKVEVQSTASGASLRL